MEKIQIEKARQGLQGEIVIPGDKSISHRSVMFSALGDTPVRIKNFLHAQDCMSTAACMEALGAQVKFISDTELIVTGNGLHGLKEPATILDAGNSGTTLRLLMGILAAQPFLSTFTGDASLHKRPMGRVIKPLSQMGAQIYGRENNAKLPITVVPAKKKLTGMHYDSPVASAQVKSAILLAGMFAEGETTWNGKTGPIKSGTEVLVKAAGVPLVTYCLQGGYFTAPRWGRGLRRGKLAGVVTGVYSAEQIHSMSGEALRSVIESGIFNHACEKQHREKIRYTGHHRMDQVDSLLFLCPKCHQIGTLHGAENLVTCSCGFSSLFNDCMFPADSSPFPDLYTWDEWQTAAFADKVREEKDLEIRDSSDELVLWEIASDHSLRLAAHGALSMNRQEMVIGDLHFSLPDIRDIALLQNRKAAIAYQDRYFELHAPHVLCLRKYLLFWQTAVSSAHQL